VWVMAFRPGGGGGLIKSGWGLGFEKGGGGYPFTVLLSRTSPGGDRRALRRPHEFRSII